MNEPINEPDKDVINYTPENRQYRSGNRVWTGLFIVGIGVILLLRQSGVSFPFWLFNWQVFLIVIGLFIGLRKNFRGGGWMIPILIGGVSLIDQIIPTLGLRNFIWPIIMIAAGLLIILRPKRHSWRDGDHRWNKYQDWMNEESFSEVKDPNDFIDVTSVFGGIKKTVLSKNFKGGDITNFMGGSEINLTQADITGTVVIDTTTIFGGTKLIVPPTWDVQSNIVTIFGGVDDKRQVSTEAHNTNKILRLEGTCLFGGIDIRSF